MKDWIVRNLPLGHELTHYRGVQPGDQVAIIGWRYPGSVDRRTVRRIVRAAGQSSVRVEIDAPLKNQRQDDPTNPYAGAPGVDFAWVRPWHLTP